MYFTPINLPSEKYYEVYRRSLIERHITSNGRLAQVVYLKDGEKPINTERFSSNVRWSEEIGLDDVPRTYFGWPLYRGNDDPSFHEKYVLLAKGDNPLLGGGLAMAAFAMEVLNGIDGENAYYYALRLFDFILESEYYDCRDHPTGFLTRRENFDGSLRNASIDELSGCLLGLFLFRQAAEYRNDKQTKERIENLLFRIATFLKDNKYVYVPSLDVVTPNGEKVVKQTSRAFAFVYMYPFSKLFEHVLGDPFVPTDPPLRHQVQSILDLTDPLSILSLRILSDASGAAPLTLYMSILEGLTSAEEILGFDKFFNFSMTCHTIVLVLLNPSVSDADKAMVATAATHMLLGIMRFPEQKGYHNAYFAVTAALCRKYAPPSAIEIMESAASMTPVSFDDEAVAAGGFLFRQACRAANWMGAATGIWASDRRKRCTNWKNSTVSEAHEDGKQAHIDCNEQATDEGEECETRYRDDLNNCLELEDEGYNVCSTFQKCSHLRFIGWICKAVETVCNWVSNLVCIAYAKISVVVCDIRKTIKKWVCNTVATAVEWGKVIGANVLNIGCQVGTWIVSGIVGLLTWPIKASACHADKSWDQRIADGMNPLMEPKDVFYRDLPLSKIANEIGDESSEFQFTNVDGDDLIGEYFTWEHRDPNHCFARRYDYSYSISNNFPLEDENGQVIPVRAEAVGLDFLYPRMLLAHIGEGPLPSIEDSIRYSTLPAVGASIKFKCSV